MLIRCTQTVVVFHVVLMVLMSELSVSHVVLIVLMFELSVSYPSLSATVSSVVCHSLYRLPLSRQTGLKLVPGGVVHNFLFNYPSFVQYQSRHSWSHTC